MATITEIRAQYPQYNDLSDKELADSLHSKFYSDIPKEEVYLKLGLKPERDTEIDVSFPEGGGEAATVPQKQESYLERLNRMSMTPSRDGSFVSGYAQGMADPFQGVLQLGTEAAAKMGVPGAQEQAAIFSKEQRDYEASRQGKGFDVGRLFGGITNPAYYTAPFTAGGLMRTGAIAGAAQPVSSEDFWTSKAAQTGLGAITGPLIKGAADVVGKVGGAVRGLTESGRQKQMFEQLSKLAGEDPSKAITALQQAKELVPGSKPTAAEALANVPSAAELVGLQSKLARQEGLVGTFAQRTADQQAARIRAVQGIAGTEAERAALAAERGAVTGPMRETALEQSDVAAPIFTKLEKDIADKFNSIAAAEQTTGMVGLAATQQQATAAAGKPGWLTAGDIAADAANRSKAYKGLAGNLRQEAKLKQFQLQSLEQNGFFPLRARDLTDQLDTAIKGTTSDQSKLVLQSLRDKIISKADENGMLSSRDLYENVRKTSNQEIAQLLGLGDKFASGGIPQKAAEALGNAKKFIDAALNKSSDNLWSKYLTNYAEYSNKLNRMEIGAFLESKLQTPLDKEGAAVFSTAVENAAGTIKKSTGIPRFSKLEQVLTKDEVGTVNSVVADLSRASKAKELSRQVGALTSGVQDAAGIVPPLIDAKITVFKGALRYLQNGNQEKFNRNMAELMLDPAALAQFLSVGIPKNKMNKLIGTIYNNLDDTMKQAFINNFTTIPLAQTTGE